MRIPAISGMVKIEKNQFLVIHDAKRTNQARLGRILLSNKGAKYKEIRIEKWPICEDLANDLEGICKVPGHDGEFFVLESGYYPKYGSFGRVIKLGVKYINGHWSAKYLGAFRPFLTPGEGKETPKEKQLEGVATLTYKSTVLMLFARRGQGKIPGKLVWGALTGIDSESPVFEFVGDCDLTPHAIGDRGASDLFVREVSGTKKDKEWEVLSVVTSDPGDDLGPFRSSVYTAGRFHAKKGKLEFVRNTSSTNVLWDIEGLKVEAITDPAEIIAASGISIATDDESLKGAWRSIAKSTGLTKPSPLLFLANTLTVDSDPKA